MTDLKGKVALVTGSSRGLGRAIVERFARSGASLVLNHAHDDEGAAAVQSLVQQLGAKAIVIKADLTQVPEIERLFAEAVQHFGQLDIVIANAGVEIIDQPCIDITEEDYEKLFSVNTKGSIFTLREAGRQVVDGGRIIYVGSSTTNFALEGCGLYGSSKMGARYFVEVLAKEIGHRLVTVNSIIPSATKGAGVFTDGANGHVEAWITSFNPMKRMCTVDDVADAAEYLAGPLSSFVSGQHLMLSGGAHT